MMHKILAFCFLLFTCTSLFAQSSDNIGVWIDHLPYGRGLDVHIEDDLVYTATEQGLFIFNTVSKTVERLSKVNGLSDVGLTCLAWADDYNLLVIGYENGNIDLVEGERVTNIPAIRQSGNYIGLKRINDIKVYGKLMYISTDFGIVTFDLDKMVTGDTYIISENGSSMPVNEVIVANDTLYAATNSGIRAGALSDPLIFFESWDYLPGRRGEINELAFFNGKLFANKVGKPSKDSVFMIDNGHWDFVESIEVGGNNDLRASRDMLCLCNSFSARAYNADLNMEINVVSEATGNPLFSPRGAVIDPSGRNMYIADAGGGGLYQNFDRLFTFELRPNSPATKSVLNLYHGESRLYVAPGAISDVWAPLFNNDGYFVLEDFEWTNVANSDFGGYKDVVAITQDPEDTSHLYVASYENGIVEIRNGEVLRLINESSTGGSLPSINGSGNHRIGGFSTDEEGNIWFTNSLTDKPLGKITPEGQVQAFSLGSAANSGTAVKKIIYTSENQVWMQTRTVGLVVARIEDGVVREAKSLRATEGQGDLPTEKVLAFAEDLDGEMWIGTDEGIAVIYSPVNVFEPNRNYDAQIIVIDEDGDGNGERVLGSETINDIEVDGSNKKWFGTATSGVFYTSANGKEQIHHFTADNSPLPSNNVLDIEIDPVSGMVYFGTDQGIVSFQGAATEGARFHSDVFAYPNPVEPGYDGPILIRGLVTNAQVKITDIEGNIIFETVAEGGQAIWNGRNFDGRRAASGVYLAYITNDDGSTTAVTKILIVN